MQKRLPFTLILAGSVVGFSCLAVILPPPSKKVTLTWEYPESNPDIVFNVYGTTNIALPLTEWPLITTVSETSCSIPMTAESAFFVVSASNVVTGLESSFSQQDLPDPVPLDPPPPDPQPPDPPPPDPIDLPVE